MPTENELIVLRRAYHAEPKGIGREEVSSAALASCREKGWLLRDETRPSWQHWYALTCAGRLLVEQDAKSTTA